MKNEIIAGLDLGSTKVVCMIGKVKDPTSSRPEIVGVGISKSNGFKNGIITGLDDATETIRMAVYEAEQQANVKLNELYIGIMGNHIKGENSRGVVSISREDKEITHEDVKQLIEQALSVKIPVDRQIIHTIPQEFIVDDQTGIKDPVGLDGSRLEGGIYIITGATSVVQNIRKAINKAGFKVREFILQSIASSYAILSPDEREIGCMVIDIGGGTTDSIIFQNGIIKDTFTVPLGGVDVTNDISIGLTISRQEAEEVKLKYGVARSELAGNEVIRIRKFNKNGEQTVERRKLASIIAPRVEEIFGLVNRKLRYMDLDTLPSGIVLTGGTAKMTGIEGLAERIFGVPVKVGVPNTVEEISEEIKNQSYVTAIGLIIYGATYKNNKRMGKESSKSWILRMGKRLEDWLLK